MSTSYVRYMRDGRALCVAASLLLSACASTGTPAYLPPPDPQSYFTVTVHSGDTLSEIADRYQVDDTVLLSMNDIDDPNDIAAGTSLRIPSYAHEHAPNDGPMLPIEPRPKPYMPQAQAEYDWRQDRVVDGIPIPQPKPVIAVAEPAPAASWWGGWFGSSTEVSAAQSQPVAPIAQTVKISSSGGMFLWPVSGTVISGFGAGRGGERNDGINIAAPRGTPVRASAAGTVTYVGNELKGYGNLVLIRHDNGYITAYAHADSVTVERGEHVDQGQTIAYAGATGDVSQPQVHFELRQGTKPVNPATFLVASD